MKKLILTTLITAMIISTSCIPALAFSNTQNSSSDLEVSDYVLKNGGSIQDQLINEKNKLKCENEQKNIIPLNVNANASKTLNIPTYQQERSYWCGPANIKQVIQYINGSSSSQSTYASSMGTNSSDGTYVYKMVNELNKRQSKFTYAYTQMNSNSKQTLANSIFFGTEQGKPCIFHSKTQYLYMYNGAAYNHYLTCSGYNFSGLEIARNGDSTNSIASSNSLDGTVFYVDTFSKDCGRGNVLGNHSDSLTNIFNSMAVNNRYLIH